MRKTYRFNHKVVQGGYLYAHKTGTGQIIENKDGLKNALNAIAKKLELIDVTVKIYDSIFFFFYMSRSVKPIELIEKIQKTISNLGAWDNDYLFTTVYDLQEEYINQDLKRWGFEYDKG